MNFYSKLKYGLMVVLGAVLLVSWLISMDASSSKQSLNQNSQRTQKGSNAKFNF